MKNFAGCHSMTGYYIVPCSRNMIKRGANYLFQISPSVPTSVSIVRRRQGTPCYEHITKQILIKQICIRQASRCSFPILPLHFHTLILAHKSSSYSSIRHVSSCIALHLKIHSGLPRSSTDRSKQTISQQRAAAPKAAKLEEQCGKMGSCDCGLILL